MADAFNNAHHLLVEAGTGTGKSLAYLLPPAPYAIPKHTPVGVSTNTINPPDQLVGKDLPPLHPPLATPPRPSPVNRRTHHLCHPRFHYPPPRPVSAPSPTPHPPHPPPPTPPAPPPPPPPLPSPPPLMLSTLRRRAVSAMVALMRPPRTPLAHGSDVLCRQTPARRQLRRAH